MQNQPQSGSQQSGGHQQGSQQGRQNNQQQGAVNRFTQDTQKPQQASWTVQSQKSGAPAAPVSAQRSGCGRMLVIGIVIGLVIAWGWSDMHRDRAADSSADTLSLSNVSTSTLTQNSSRAGSREVAPAGVASSAAIVATTTQAAGSSMVVDSITTADPVWAVVYEYTDGQLGRVLGAGRFTSERNSGQVELMRSTLPGLTYFVGLAADSADHSFSIGQNAPLVNASGKQIGVVVTTQ